MPSGSSYISRVWVLSIRPWYSRNNILLPWPFSLEKARPLKLTDFTRFLKEKIKAGNDLYSMFVEVEVKALSRSDL